jgi:hypothetical protein
MCVCVCACEPMGVRASLPLQLAGGRLPAHPCVSECTDFRWAISHERVEYYQQLMLADEHYTPCVLLCAFRGRSQYGINALILDGTQSALKN